MNDAPFDHLPAGSDLRALAELASSVGKPRKNPDQDGASYAVVPPEWQVQALPTHEPTRPDHCVMLRDARSFIDYVNRLGDGSTIIYCQLNPARFLAVMQDTAVSPDGALVPTHRDWRCDFTVPPSREWLLWNGANRRQMGQLDFACLLQDNLPDIIEPDGSELLALVLNFEAAISGQFQAAQRLQDGSTQLAWRSDTSTGTLKLPEFIKLSIPVFENEPRRELQARFRYRIKEGSLSLWYELVRPHVVLDIAFRELWQRIEDGTKRLLLLGAPE